MGGDFQFGDITVSAGTMTMAALMKRVLDVIVASPSKICFSDLSKHFKNENQVSRQALKRAVSKLIHSGRLCYTSHYGRSFIELSYDQPLLVSQHVIVKPPSTSWCTSGRQYVVSLERGASFGGGEHATTRMAIELIDDLLHQPPWWGKRASMQAIDVGTGSGILALVAASIGLKLIHGIDTDPCSVFEARRNFHLNGKQDCITILQEPLEDINLRYDLILANLRAPTLLGLGKTFEKLATKQSALIFSGLNTAESGKVCQRYYQKGYRMQKKRTEKGWCAICLVRG
jgi:ribosomal protein L11 methyltransferase